MCPEKSHPEENKEKALLGYTQAVDAWALGVLAYELIVGHPPFERETRTDTYKQIMYRRPHYPSALSEGSCSFIAAALTKVTCMALLQNFWPMYGMANVSGCVTLPRGFLSITTQCHQRPLPPPICWMMNFRKGRKFVSVIGMLTMQGAPAS